MKGFLKATAKGKWVHLLALCWCYLCSVTHREMRDFNLQPEPLSQGFRMLALWDQCLYTEWEHFFILRSVFLFTWRNLAECLYICVFCCFDLDHFFKNLKILDFGNCGVLWWLGVLVRVIRENDLITHRTCNNSLWSIFEKQRIKVNQVQISLDIFPRICCSAFISVLYLITVENMPSHFNWCLLGDVCVY